MSINKGKREKAVLEAIVKNHVRSASPVGSTNIARTLDLSSATIRNVMFDLEKKGLVTQPHTSAGRVPTDMGYRKYVDDIMDIQGLTDEEILHLVRSYITGKEAFDEIYEDILHAMTILTNYTSMALSPANKLYFDGMYHMLEQPEFREIAMIRDLFRILEEREEITQILAEDMRSAGTKVRIGRENQSKGLKNCTVITSTYKLKDETFGNIGIIGPMRMKYDKVIPLIDKLAEVTSELIEELMK